MVKKRKTSEGIKRIQEMDTRLRELEIKSTEFFTAQGAEKKDTDHIKQLIFGNGRNGLVVRLDRLEQSEKVRKWHIRTLWVGIVGLVISLIVGNFQEILLRMIETP